MNLFHTIHILMLVLFWVSVCKAVFKITMTSEFPSSGIMVQWTQDNDTNFAQYLIQVNDSSTNKCLLWLTISCPDCYGTSQTVTNPLDCKNVTSGDTFSRNQSLINVTINDSSVEPYTDYFVIVFADNVTSRVRNRTAQYLCDPVRNLTMNSQFPNRSLILTWDVPKKSNGVIVEYVVQLLNNTQCVLWWSIKCQDCINNTKGTNGKKYLNATCQLNDTVANFNKGNQSIITTTMDSRIRGDVEYTVIIVPINGYGWGMSTNVTNKTSQYESGRVEDVTIESNFPNDNLIINWTFPSQSNGQIVSYYIYVNDSVANSCLLFLNLTCTDCNKFPAVTQSTFGNPCRYPFLNGTFSNQTRSISTNITHPFIQPSSNYSVYIVPVNGYGPGKSWFGNVLTKSYTPQPVASLSSTVNGTIITVIWTAPLNETFTNYTLYMTWNNGTSVRNLSSSFTNHTVNGTDFCQSYNICIRVTTPYGSGRNSCIVTNTSLSTIVIVGNISIKDFKINWSYSGQSKCQTKFKIICNDTQYEVTNQNFVNVNVSYYTTYNVTVIPLSYMANDNETKTGEGLSEIVTSDIGRPSIVRNFACTNVTFNEFICTWKEPKERNGPSIIYDIVCRSDKLNLNSSTAQLAANVSQDVVPEVNYTCGINARTEPSLSSPISNTSIIITASGIPDVSDGGGIGKTMSSNTQESSTTTIAITLPCNHFSERFGRIIKFTLVVTVNERFKIDTFERNYVDKPYSECNKGFDCAYGINVTCKSLNARRRRAIGDSKWKNIEYVIGANGRCQSGDGINCNGELSPNTEYEIGFRVYTSVGFGTYGFIRKSTKFNMLPVMVAVPIVVILVVAAVIVAVIMYRQRKRTKHKRNDSTPLPDDVKFRDSSAKISAFGDYYKYVMKDSCVRASLQFTEIDQRWKELEHSKKLVYHVGDEVKNRFKNIKPYVHNMVRLRGHSETYINASRICMLHFTTDVAGQCSCTNCYIATQGPLSTTTANKVGTIGDFWRMVIESDVKIIVNLTRCVELYKEKCAQYWPEMVNDEETHFSDGHIVTVTLKKVVMNDVYDERELIICMDGKEISVVQLHFTIWPDHGCPDVRKFLRFYDRFVGLRREQDQIVVHCSAGVGRTGTFILIDIELRKAFENSGKVEIYNTLTRLRNSRCLMVQTEKQYLFVHAIIHQYLKQNALLEKKENQANGNRESTYSFLNPAFE